MVRVKLTPVEDWELVHTNFVKFDRSPDCPFETVRAHQDVSQDTITVRPPPPRGDLFAKPYCTVIFECGCRGVLRWGRQFIGSTNVMLPEVWARDADEQTKPRAYEPPVIKSRGKVAMQPPVVGAHDLVVGSVLYRIEHREYAQRPMIYAYFIVGETQRSWFVHEHPRAPMADKATKKVIKRSLLEEGQTFTTHWAGKETTREPWLKEYFWPSLQTVRHVFTVVGYGQTDYLRKWVQRMPENSREARAVRAALERSNVKHERTWMGKSEGVDWSPRGMSEAIEHITDPDVLHDVLNDIYAQLEEYA